MLLSIASKKCGRAGGHTSRKPRFWLHNRRLTGLPVAGGLLAAPATSNRGHPIAATTGGMRLFEGDRLLGELGSARQLDDHNVIEHEAPGKAHSACPAHASAADAARSRARSRARGALARRAHDARALARARRGALARRAHAARTRCSRSTRCARSTRTRSPTRPRSARCARSCRTRSSRREPRQQRAPRAPA